MTIMEAISRIDILKPNSYTEKEKILWLSHLDGIIKSEIIDTHEGHEDITFEGYTGDTLTTTELLVPPPYDDIYLKWLEMQMDYTNAEYGKYNNSMAVYNEAYQEYARWHNRNHMPLSKGTRFNF
jgi:hypothetical protein